MIVLGRFISLRVRNAFYLLCRKDIIRYLLEPLPRLSPDPYETHYSSGHNLPNKNTKDNFCNVRSKLSRLVSPRTKLSIINSRKA